MISLDLTPDEIAAQDDLAIPVNNNPLRIKYPVDGANQEEDPKREMSVVIG